jgi:hypothetical protein
MLRDEKRPTHAQSQLASVAWFNGTSSWLYYQGVNGQLREFGIDNYRDLVWRDVSIGPLGLMAGTYKVYVRQFTPIEGDSLERRWKTNGEPRSYKCSSRWLRESTATQATLFTNYLAAAYLSEP